MPRKEKAYHFIYKTTCLITNRFYIGMHSTNNLEDGYLGSGKRLRYSVKKYGEENHRREILEFCEDRESLAKREEELITNEILNEDLCMNLKTGGNGGFISVEQQRKRSELGGLAFSEKLKNDTEFSEAYRKNMSDSITEWWKDNNETRQKIIEANKARKGFKHSEETKRKMSESSKGKGKGSKNSQFGTCWVTDGNKPIKIKREDLDHYLSIGYQRGRKL